MSHTSIMSEARYTGPVFDSPQEPLGGHEDVSRHQKSCRLRTGLAPCLMMVLVYVPAVNGSGWHCHGSRCQAEELSFSRGRRAGADGGGEEQRHSNHAGRSSDRKRNPSSTPATRCPIRPAGSVSCKSYEEAHTLVQSGDTKVVLQIGKDEWPFPIPLVKGSTGWRFDTRGGQGRDPQSAHRTQRTRRHPGVPGLCRRATRILRAQPTTRCAAPVCLKVHQHEGQTRRTVLGNRRPTSRRVHWVPSWPGPEREGYKRTAGKPVPYHGYYYKMLTRQGPNAPDGAYDYVVRGKMIGGFALVAYPAQYGSSGIMTFIVNHDGIVYQKDFGPNTAAMAQSMTKFNPDKTWKKLQGYLPSP